MMQFANNLALLCLCHPPTVGEMSDVLSRPEHREKGAIRGLCHLGLLSDAKLADKDEIKKALELLHSHLDQHLCKEFKAFIRWEGFGYLHIEHFLCKIGRWLRELTSPDYTPTKKRKKKGEGKGNDGLTSGNKLEEVAKAISAWKFKPDSFFDKPYESLPFPLKIGG
jgi:hypothetical protein